MRALSILRAGFGAFEHGTDATVNCRVDENCWAVPGQGEVQPDASLADANDHLEAHKGVLREQILTLLALQGRLGQLEVPEHIDLRVPNNFQETHLSAQRGINQIKHGSRVRQGKHLHAEPGRAVPAGPARDRRSAPRQRPRA